MRTSRPLLAAVGCVAVACAIAVAIPWLQDYREDQAFLDRVAARAALAGREPPERETRRPAPSRRAQTAAAERQRVQAAAVLRESRASAGPDPRDWERSVVAGCESGGQVPPSIQVAACKIGTALHGDPSGMRLTVSVARPVAAAIAVKDVEARAALVALADSWRLGIGRNLGYVDVFYGQAHLATVRATDSGPARITFH